jgi:hypothetical protein
VTTSDQPSLTGIGLRFLCCKVLYRHPDHSLALRVFSLYRVALFCPAKNAK